MASLCRCGAPTGVHAHQPLPPPQVCTRCQARSWFYLWDLTVKARRLSQKLPRPLTAATAWVVDGPPGATDASSPDAQAPDAACAARDPAVATPPAAAAQPAAVAESPSPSPRVLAAAALLDLRQGPGTALASSRPGTPLPIQQSPVLHISPPAKPFRTRLAAPMKSARPGREISAVRSATGGREIMVRRHRCHSSSLPLMR